LTNVRQRASTRNTAIKPVIDDGLISAITEHIGDRHSTVSDDDRFIIALWIIHTYFYGDIGSTPYLHISSLETGCGKSVIRNILNDLCYDAQIVFPTVAAMSIFKENARHTMVLDEIQLLIKSKPTDQHALYALLNLGNQPGVSWQVCKINMPGETDDRDIYFPKALIGLDPGIFHETLSRRSIRIMVTKGTETDQDDRERRQSIRPVRETASKLKARLESIAKNNALHTSLKNLMLDVSTRTLNDGSRIHDAVSDLWRPLIAIADMIDSEYGKQIRGIVSERVTSEPEQPITIADAIDSKLREVMGSYRLTVFGWHGKSESPLPPRANFALANSDFGFPRPRNGARNKLPEGSLVFNPERKRAELRFISREFTTICEAIGVPRNEAISAYRAANRLHAQNDVNRPRSTIYETFISNQPKQTIVAIDVSRWFWPDAPLGTLMEKEMDRLLTAENPWEE